MVGGDDSGFEESLFLVRFARRVTIVEFEPEVRVSAVLQEKVARRDDIKVVTNHAVRALKARDGDLDGVLAENRRTGEVEEWHPDGAFVFVGMPPDSDLLPDGIKREDGGSVRTDGRLTTTMEGVFAAGDVRAGSTKQAATAAGEGVAAALMIPRYLQAS